MRSDRLGETLLPKRLALPDLRQRRAVVGGLRPGRDPPDPGLAGGASPLTHSWQIGARASSWSCSWSSRRYRQNVHAYPSGGGDYEVATVNLGPKAGLTVASALLVDYVLTVAVSMSSGVQNAGVGARLRPRARGDRGGRRSSCCSPR